MTIEERAAKVYPPTNEFSLTSFNFGIMLERRGAYIKGATEQQKIDIEKACEWLSNYMPLLQSDCCASDLVNDFKQAMEE